MNHTISAVVGILSVALSAGAADPWADAVVAYDPGGAAGGGFTDPLASLGEPTRVTAPGSAFGGPVTPFNSPFGGDELVTIGEGGSLTVRFDEPVTDDPLNPFGIDLLVFGNAFLFLSGFPADATTTATGVFNEGGEVQVSADGVTFVTVPGVDADALFPTLGFTDIVDPFQASASAPTDFTLPVDPAFDPIGLTTPQIVAGYAGSGGGAGIDLADVGLAEISFVRIVNPTGSGLGPEIDAFADVTPIPEPAAALLATLTTTLAATFGSRRR